MVDTQDSNLMLKSRTETEIWRILTIEHEFITILHPENQPHSDHQPQDSMEKKEGWESPQVFYEQEVHLEPTVWASVTFKTRR